MSNGTLWIIHNLVVKIPLEKLENLKKGFKIYAHDLK